MQSLIVAGNTRVLVDAGLSAKEIVRRLALVGEDAQRLDGVLVTHEHGDHAGGLRVLLGSVDCPVYISAQTLDAYVSERFNVTSDEPRPVPTRCAIASNRSSRVRTFASARSTFTRSRSRTTPSTTSVSPRRITA